MIQVYTSQETWLDLVIFPSDLTSLFFSSFILFLFFSCFQYVESSFGEYVFLLKRVRMHLCQPAEKRKKKKVIDIELTVKIRRVQSKAV